MKYNGWDIDYQQNRDDYIALFDSMMIKEYEGSVESLEQQVSDYTGRKYCVAVSSATDALRFSLKDIGPGDEVIVSNFSWISSSSCITMVGATPVFCDIDLDSYHISFDSIKRMKTDKTKALIYTHLFGNMTDTTEIEQWCADNNIKFIEDAAQSLGSSLNGRKAGTIGDCSSYSFNANKVVGGISGGGMFMTDNEEEAQYVRMIRRHGKDKDFSFVGYNSKMFVPNAEVIQYRMNKMEQWQKRRNEIAEIYNAELSDDFIVPIVNSGLEHNFHKYVIRFDTKAERKRVKDAIKSQGINLSVHYEKALNNNSLYNNVLYISDDTPNSIKAADTVLSLPIHAWLNDDDIYKLCNMLMMA